MSKLITESSSNYDDLEKKSTLELLNGMNKEDKSVPEAIEKELSSIEHFIDTCFERMKEGGRLFYIGSGTSGRLGIVDASECPPTYGVDHGVVVGIIAGGDGAIRKAVEFAEDNPEQGWKDLLEHDVNEKDTLVGISASGGAPYVIGALQMAKENGLLTAAVSCNKMSIIGGLVDHRIEVVVGPEFVSGSTRMKAGTAQKLILNMISTSLMIKLGHVKGNKMVDMALSNKKLIQRGAKMIMDATGCSKEQAIQHLNSLGSVRKAIEQFKD